MLFERLFDSLALSVEPFAVCEVSPGWRLRMDRLDLVTLHFVLRGEGRLRAGTSATHALVPWSLGVVPPRLPHAIESGKAVLHEAAARDVVTKENGLLQIVAGPERAGSLVAACGLVEVVYAGSLGLFDLMNEAIVLDFSDSDDMRGTFEHLLEEQRTSSPGSRAMMTALMNQCLVLVFRRLCADPACDLPWLTALEEPRLAPVLEAVFTEPERPHSVESLAAQAFMSRSVFAERFAALFGRTPMAFVRDVRLRRGADLLRSTDLPVNTVASRVGFASRSHFSRAFRDYFGRSPGRFRASTL